MWLIKKHHFNWVLLLIDLVVVGMIVGIAFLILWFFGGKNRAEPSAPSTTSTSTPATEAQIEKNYFTGIAQLDASLNSGISSAELFKRVESVLLSVHVPRFMQEAHLRAVLLLGKLQADAGTLNDADIHARVRDILQHLSRP